MPPDGAFKTHTSLRETLNQADLDLPYFRTTEQNSPGLMQFANHKTAISPLAGKLIAQQTSIYWGAHNVLENETKKLYRRKNVVIINRKSRKEHDL